MRSIVQFSTLSALVLAACAGQTHTDAGPEEDAATETAPEETEESQEAATPDWSGSWRVTVEWSATCEYGWDSVETIEGSDSWNLVFYGSSDQLEVRVNDNGWYTLTGVGDGEGLSICGSFPMYDISGDQAASGVDNNLCIDASDVVSDQEVHGVMEGRFKGGLAEKCEMNLSPLILSR